MLHRLSLYVHDYLSIILDDSFVHNWYVAVKSTFNTLYKVQTDSRIHIDSGTVHGSFFPYSGMTRIYLLHMIIFSLLLAVTFHQFFPRVR